MTTQVNLIRLVYVSYACEEYTSSELFGLLKESRNNNLNLNITGMLLYAGDNFLQVLEGPLENVENLYKSIKKDPRHEDCSIVDKQMIDERLFTDWSMSFNNLNDTEVSTLKGFDQFLQKKNSPVTFVNQSHKVYELLTNFKHRNEEDIEYNKG